MAELPNESYDDHLRQRFDGQDDDLLRQGIGTIALMRFAGYIMTPTGLISGINELANQQYLRAGLEIAAGTGTAIALHVTRNEKQEYRDELERRNSQ